MPASPTVATPVMLSEDALQQLKVLVYFLDPSHSPPTGYQSNLHLVGTAFWEACLRTEVLFVLIDLVASADLHDPLVKIFAVFRIKNKTHFALDMDVTI